MEAISTRIQKSALFITLTIFSAILSLKAQDTPTIDTATGTTDDSVSSDTFTAAGDPVAADTISVTEDSIPGSGLAIAEDTTRLDTVPGDTPVPDTAGAVLKEPPGAEGTVKRDHHTEMSIAVRLFNGLTGTDLTPVNCASCHNLTQIDTMNFNPSAVEIAHSTHDMDSATFANILLNPQGKRLSEAHQGIEMTGQEIVLIRHYLEEVEEIGLKPKKADITRLLLFLVLVLLIGLAIADIFFFRIFKFKMIPLAVMLLAAGWVTRMIVHDAVALGRSEDYAPLQPIKFSHAIHAGENQIDCQYCHFTAEESKSAGIPPMELCLNCHSLVRDATRSGRFEINKIHAAIESGDPVEWIRVHRLPDYVYFSHAQHVGAGKLECKECHGPVEEMHVLRQHSDLSMGWCLDCHRSRAVEFSESEYYRTTFEKFHQFLEQDIRDSILVSDIGGTDCMRCHY